MPSLESVALGRVLHQTAPRGSAFPPRGSAGPIPRLRRYDEDAASARCPSRHTSAGSRHFAGTAHMQLGTRSSISATHAATHQSRPSARFPAACQDSCRGSRAWLLNWRRTFRSIGYRSGRSTRFHVLGRRSSLDRLATSEMRAIAAQRHHVPQSARQRSDRQRGEWRPCVIPPKEPTVSDLPSRADSQSFEIGSRSPDIAAASGDRQRAAGGSRPA